MERRNCRLEGIESGSSRHHCLLHQRYSFHNELPVPQRSDLLLDGDQISMFIRSCGPAGLMQQHERKKPNGFRLRYELYDEPAETERVVSDIPANEIITRGRIVSLVIDEETIWSTTLSRSPSSCLERILYGICSL